VTTSDYDFTVSPYDYSPRRGRRLSIDGFVGRALWGMLWRLFLVGGLWLLLPTQLGTRAMEVAVAWAMLQPWWMVWRCRR
jgi:hypothetical protein